VAGGMAGYCGGGEGDLTWEFLLQALYISLQSLMFTPCSLGDDSLRTASVVFNT
jgi:hypothetical protein